MISDDVYNSSQLSDVRLLTPDAEHPEYTYPAFLMLGIVVKMHASIPSDWKWVCMCRAIRTPLHMCATIYPEITNYLSYFRKIWIVG